jgi:hypothetical protein
MGFADLQYTVGFAVTNGGSQTAVAGIVCGAAGLQRSRRASYKRAPEFAIQVCLESS